MMYIYIKIQPQGFILMKNEMPGHTIILLMLSFLFFSCNEEEQQMEHDHGNDELITKSITYDGVTVDLVIDKPGANAFDVLMVFRGTLRNDSLALEASGKALERFKGILDREDMMIISVAYPEENLLFGDNIQHAEAALLWLRHEAEDEMGIKVNRVFLVGHSQGGYLVTRLNTMHHTDGVIANAPGPLSLVFRCQLEEDDQIPGQMECALLYDSYGSVHENPDPYFERSLLNYTSGYQSDILFIQGLEDGPIHMHSWPQFKADVESCLDCQTVDILELPGFGHGAILHSPVAIQEFNDFIDR